MLMSHLATVEFYKNHPIEFASGQIFIAFNIINVFTKKISRKKNNYTSQPNKTHTVKPALNGHPWDPRKCLLNTGCPLNTGSI